MATADQDPRQELERLVDLACDEAKRRGAQHARVRGSSSHNTQVVIRDGKQEEVKAAASRSLRLEIYVDGRYGTHETSILDPGELRTFIARATAMTKVLMPDPQRALPDAQYYAGRSTADLGIYDAGHGRVTMDQRQQRAVTAHDAARRAAGPRVLSVGGAAADQHDLSVLRTTNGFADSEQSTSFWVWAEVSVKDPSGRRPNDWAVAGARTHDELPDPREIGQEAAQRTLAAVGAEKIASLTLPLIVENRAVRRLLGGLLAPLSGRALDQQRSCLDKSLGQPIASPALAVVDDPLLRGGWGSRRFDSEGLTARQRPLLEQGVLRTFFIDAYYARKLEREPTSGGASNLVFAPGSDDLAALCRRAERAILVSAFLGGNSNSTTGDFSHGIRGFLVEKGLRTRPIASMNIAGNHQTFWQTLQAVGNDPYPHGSQRTPSLLFAPTVIAGR
jgi:PmbA protein